MSEPGGITVSGGGSIAVDTPSMLAARSVLEQLRQGLAALGPAVAACSAAASGPQRQALADAHDALVDAERSSGEAAEAIGTAALRYGAAEQASTQVEQLLSAETAGFLGSLTRLLVAASGPTGFLFGAELTVLLGIARLTARYLFSVAQDGSPVPWLNPGVLAEQERDVSAIDDWVRGYLLLETFPDALRDDPSALGGSEDVAGALSLLLGAPSTVAVRRTTRHAVRAPRNLVDIAGRLPDGSEPEGQVRIEQYPDGRGGSRWIVYSAGTVTFAPDSGKEVFDMKSNLAGVGDRTADSQQAVLEAMRQAGVRRDEPVLLVGHSQGALNAVRIAQHGGYRVGGVVEFGGPTGQIPTPGVPRLAFEHDQDPVPGLGGVAATGAAGLSRVLVRRSVPEAQPDLRTLGGAVPSHDMRLYTETARLAEASPAQQVRDFDRRIAAFTSGGEGTATRYHAERVSPARDRPAGAAAAPRSTR